MARRHTAEFRHAISGAGVAEAAEHTAVGHDSPQGKRLLRIEPQSPGLWRRIWWGAGSRGTAVWAARQRMNLMGSTLLAEDTGIPFDQLQAEQIQLFRDEWAVAGHDFTPRVSVSRSVIPIVDHVDNMYFGLRARADSSDQLGMIDGFLYALERATSAILRALPATLPPMLPFKALTRSCSLCQTILVLPTTPRCWPTLPSTSPRPSAGNLRCLNRHRIHSLGRQRLA